MDATFKGKVALITGAGSGIGLATAKAFAEAGASVALADISDRAVQKEVDELRHAGHGAIAVECDVSDEDSVASAISEVISSLGRLDVAFNNAGIQIKIQELAEVSNEEYERVMSINLRGVWNCMKHELKYMRTRGSGAIVNCSSIGGLVGNPGLAAYHATKYGVLGMTQSAAIEYAARGININAVCPGTIDTPMVSAMVEKEPRLMSEINSAIPIGRIGRAEEVAAAVLWLCSPAASFVVGHALVVDGGYTAR